MSSLTENQVVAAALSLGAFLMLWFADSVAYLLPPPFELLRINLSLIGHFKPMVTGSVFLSDIGYFVTAHAGAVPDDAAAGGAMSDRRLSDADGDSVLASPVSHRLLGRSAGAVCRGACARRRSAAGLAVPADCWRVGRHRRLSLAPP